MVNINSSDKIRHWLVLLFFVSLPFERLLTFDLAGYTIKLSYIFGLIILVYALVLLAKKQFSLTLYRDELWLALFGLLTILTTFWSIDQKRSLIISLTIVFMLLLFYVLRRIIDPKLKEKIISIFIILGVLLSLFALWQFFIDKTSYSSWSLLRSEYVSGVFAFARVQSTFLEPLYFANYLLIPIFFCLYRLGQKYNKLLDSRTLSKNINGVYYFALTIISLAFFLTLSRGAIIALVISLVLVGLIQLFYQRDKIGSYIKQISLIVFSFVLALFCVFAVAGETGVSEYFGHSTFADTAAQGSTVDRQNTIQVAAVESFKHPFGLGAGAFGALPEYRADIASEGYQTVNNLYLEILVESGFLGLILFLLFVWNYALSLVKNFSKNKIWTTLAVGLFLAFLTQYLFFSTIYIIYIWAVLAILSPKVLKS